MAGQLRPDQRIVGSEQAHYTHQANQRCVEVGIFVRSRADERGRMRLDALEDELRKGDVGTVVATLGTTAMARWIRSMRFRRLPDATARARACRRGVWRVLWADSRCVGRAGSASLCGDRRGRLHRDRSPQARAATVRLRVRAVQRPRSGTVLQARFALHIFHVEGIAFSEISLECSRAGAAAVALWATQRAVAADQRRSICDGLRKGRRAALELDRRIRKDERFEALAAGAPELDIVVWAVRVVDPWKASEQARKVFDACAQRGLHWL